jgi:hypothetical protein
MYRATHQVLNDGRIFADPSRYLGLNVDLITRGQDHRYGRNMRDFISAKTRFAENLDTRKRKRIAVRVAAPFRRLRLGCGSDLMFLLCTGLAGIMAKALKKLQHTRKSGPCAASGNFETRWFRLSAGTAPCYRTPKINLCLLR